MYRRKNKRATGSVKDRRMICSVKFIERRFCFHGIELRNKSQKSLDAGICRSDSSYYPHRLRQSVLSTDSIGLPRTSLIAS